MTTVDGGSTAITTKTRNIKTSKTSWSRFIRSHPKPHDCRTSILGSSRPTIRKGSTFWLMRETGAVAAETMKRLVTQGHAPRYQAP